VATDEKQAHSPRRRLAHLFHDPGIVTRETPLDEIDPWLFPAEAAAAVRFSEKRRREFAVGRTCARAALAELGIEGFPLLADEERAPIWPTPLLGTITHTDGHGHGYCGVAVAARDAFLGMGVDAEPRQPLPLDVWPLVLDAGEQRAARAANDPGIHARLIFSAKETTYKALYPVLRHFLDFSRVHVDIFPGQGSFISELLGPSPANCPKRFTGLFSMDDELMLTGMSLPRFYEHLA
jgi:4'-phosphopantetheinyl transferase EntD